MEDDNASLLVRLYEKAGLALELFEGADTEEEAFYWLGQAECAMELIADETGESFTFIRAEIEQAWDSLSLADRVNEAFDWQSWPS